MDVKKSPKADLENRKGLFLQIGLIIALLATYVVLEWKTYDRTLQDLGTLDLGDLEEEIIPITERQKQQPPPPPPPPPQEVIQVVDNEVELEEELEIESTEIEQSDEVEIEDVVVEEEEVEEIFNFQVVEDKPIFPGCEKKKNKQERDACFQSSILKHVKKHFRYPEIAREMGVQGRVIVKFVIQKNGEVGQIEVLRGVDKNLDKEAIRIVEKLPNIKPAKQRGKPVSVSFMLPITFRLQ